VVLIRRNFSYPFQRTGNCRLSLAETLGFATIWIAYPNSKSNRATWGHRGSSPTVRQGVDATTAPCLTVGLLPRSLTSVPILVALI